MNKCEQPAAVAVYCESPEGDAPAWQTALEVWVEWDEEAP